jgi:hypothetical protein
MIAKDKCRLPQWQAQSINQLLSEFFSYFLPENLIIYVDAEKSSAETMLFDSGHTKD